MDAHFCLEKRIQSGQRADTEAMVLVRRGNLIRDGIPVWRSASDMIMTSGVKGRIPVSSLVKFIGIKHRGERVHNRVGQ
eukprot:2034426-Pyramimonas_sp.AAC.1